MSFILCDLVRLLYLTMYEQKCVYIQLLYSQVALLFICVYVCYWLLIMHCVIGWAYFTYDVCLCGYYVITDIFVALFISCNITTRASGSSDLTFTSFTTYFSSVTLGNCHRGREVCPYRRFKMNMYSILGITFFCNGMHIRIFIYHQQDRYWLLYMQTLIQWDQ